MQSTEATWQSTEALEQRLQEAEIRRQQEAAQHSAEMKEQKARVAWLSNLVNTEVKAQEEANAALKQAKQEQTSTKEQVAALSAELKAALDQIHELSVDLATTRSRLDAAPQPKATEGQAGTSTVQQTSMDQKQLQAQ